MGLHSVAQGGTGLHRAAYGCNELPSCLGLHRVAGCTRCIEFRWVSQDCTGLHEAAVLHRVEQGCTGLHRVA